jgi:hypothetical protein
MNIINKKMTKRVLFQLGLVLILAFNFISCKEDDNRIYKNTYSTIIPPNLSWSVIGKKDSVVKVRVRLKDSGSRNVVKMEFEYYEDSFFTSNKKTIMLASFNNKIIDLDITKLSSSNKYWARVVVTTDLDTFHFNPSSLSNVYLKFNELFAQNLVLYCPFDGNSQDESGNGNHGIVSGSIPTTDRYNNANNAYSFDGVDDYIEVAHHQSLNCSTVSISVWFKTNNYLASNGFQPHLLSKREGSGWGNSFQMYVGIDQSQYSCGANWSISGNGWIYYTNSAVLNTSNWFNLIYTHDGTNVKLYLNGTLVETIVSPGLLTFNTLPLWFGARPNAGSNSQWFNGKLDDIAIWNRVLSDKEVMDVYTY